MKIISLMRLALFTRVVDGLTESAAVQCLCVEIVNLDKLAWYLMNTIFTKFQNMV